VHPAPLLRSMYREVRVAVIDRIVMYAPPSACQLPTEPLGAIAELHSAHLEMLPLHCVVYLPSPSESPRVKVAERDTLQQGEQRSANKSLGEASVPKHDSESPARSVPFKG